MAPTLIPTGVKAYMEDDEVLYIYNRSSNPKKKGLILANSVGVIDKDYYGNQDNDGHIMVAFFNFKDEDVKINKGDAAKILLGGAALATTGFYSAQSGFQRDIVNAPKKE